MSGHEPQHHHMRESVVGMVTRCEQCQQLYIPVDHSGCCESCWPEELDQKKGEQDGT